MTIVRTLLARLGLDVDKSGFKQAESGFSKMKSQMSSIASAANGLTANLTAAGAALGGLAATKSLIQANVEIEGLKASLVGVEGSMDAANKKWDELKTLARETPFQLGEVTGAYTRMANLGLDASDRMINAFGDISASLPGKNIMDFVEAVADGVGGETERLKEFGIKSKKDGDKITFQFADLTKTVKNDAASIQVALAEIAEEKFGGTMARQMDTLGGRFSNLKDVAFQFAEAVGEAGLSDAVRRLTNLMIEWTTASNGLAVQLGTGLGIAIDGLSASMQFLADNSELAKTAVLALGGAVVALKVGSAIASIAGGIAAIAPIVASIATALIAAAKTLVFIGSTGLAIILAKFAALAAFVMGIFDGLGGIKGITDLLGQAWANIMNGLMPLFQALKRLLSTIGGILRDVIMPPFFALGQLVGKIIGAVIGPMSEAFGFILEVFGALVDGANFLLEVLGDILNAVVMPFFDVIVGFFKFVWGALETVGKILKKLGVFNFFRTAFNAAKRFFGFFRDAWDSISSVIRDTGAAIFNPLLGALESFIDFIKDIIRAIPASLRGEALSDFLDEPTDFKIRTSAQVAASGIDFLDESAKRREAQASRATSTVQSLLKVKGATVEQLNVNINGNPNGTPSQIGQATRDGVGDAFGDLPSELGDIRGVEF